MEDVKETDVIHEISSCVAWIGLESDKKVCMLINIQPHLHPYKKLTVRAAINEIKFSYISNVGEKSSKRVVNCNFPVL